jgi:hypothetical protein
MRRKALCAVMVLLCPIAGYATDVDLPEMGIRISNLPAGATASKVAEYADASSVSVHVGDAVLHIERLSDRVPSGSTVADSSYRQSLQANFRDDLGPKARTQATSISGFPAWTMSSATLLAPVSTATYTCITYVVAYEHAYRLRAYMRAPYDSKTPNNAPPDYLAVVQAMSDTTFGPVTAVAALTAQLSPRNLKMANLPNIGLYPEVARAHNEEGVVDVEYSVDGKGRVHDATQIYASSPRLGERVPEFLKAVVFRVPANWEATGSQNARYNMEFQFLLTTSSSSQQCGPGPEPRIAEAEVISVCSTRLRSP